MPGKRMLRLNSLLLIYLLVFGLGCSRDDDSDSGWDLDHDIGSNDDVRELQDVAEDAAPEDTAQQDTQQDSREESDTTPPDPDIISSGRGDIIFVLSNQSGEMRYVDYSILGSGCQFRNGWLRLFTESGENIYPGAGCGDCECGQEPCAVCDCLPETVEEFPPGEERRLEWDLSQWIYHAEDMCIEQVDFEESSLRVEFCWGDEAVDGSFGGLVVEDYQCETRDVQITAQEQVIEVVID